MDEEEEEQDKLSVFLALEEWLNNESNETVDKEEDELSLFLQLEHMVKDEEMDEEEKNKSQNMSLFLELQKNSKLQEDMLK